VYVLDCLLEGLGSSSGLYEIRPSLDTRFSQAAFCLNMTDL
jgi:hypothetical protein